MLFTVKDLMNFFLDSRLNLIKRLRRYVAYNFQSNKWLIPEHKQEYNFQSVDLDRNLAKNKVSKILTEVFDIDYDVNDGMISEHWLLFGALSNRIQPQKILEIGTYDARTALVLSHLFPRASITTIDLPQGEEFESTAGRNASNARSFAEKRNNLLRAAKNIEFIEMNSVELIDSCKEFDLIWVDGAHGYPVVAIDILNAFRLCSKGGIVMLDDVWTHIEGKQDPYNRSVGSYEVLKLLKETKLISKYTLIPKRLSGKKNAPWRQKFVAIFEKN